MGRLGLDIRDQMQHDLVWMKQLIAASMGSIPPMGDVEIEDNGMVIYFGNDDEHCAFQAYFNYDLVRVPSIIPDQVRAGIVDAGVSVYQCVSHGCWEPPDYDYVPFVTGLTSVTEVLFAIFNHDAREQFNAICEAAQALEVPHD